MKIRSLQLCLFVAAFLGLLSTVIVYMYLQTPSSEGFMLHKYFDTDEEVETQFFINDSRLSSLLNIYYTDFRQTGDKLGYDFWTSITPSFKCPTLERIGKEGDGGKWVCGLNNLAKKSESCNVYSFGVHNESSFEAELYLRTGCKIYTFDPTVTSIGYPLSTESNSDLHFEKVGLDGENNDTMRTLGRIMENNGNHTWIDVLKMDIERSEYPALENIMEEFSTVLPFGQLLVEFHVRPWTQERAQTVVELLEKLEKRGLRLFSTEPFPKRWDLGCEFSFINLYSLPIFLAEEDINLILGEFNETGFETA